MQAATVEDKRKLEEFRQSNASLLKQLEGQRKRFEGIDPEEVRKLTDEKRKLEEERQIKAGEVEKVVEIRKRWRSAYASSCPCRFCYGQSQSR